ncbi:MAG: hydrolase [Sphingobium phenoxybenzoativorans]
MVDTVFDPATTALVAIDLQHGIVNLEAVPHKSGDVVANTAKIAKALRDKGGVAVFVRVTNSEDGADALSPTTDIVPPVAPPRPSYWAELVPKLNIKDGDIIVTKRQWGAFYGTDLEMHLRRRGIKTIILTGIATNIGVESTARDAYERGFDQIFVEDATSALNAEAHKHSFTLFGRMGRVRSTEQVLDVLAG